MTCGKRGHQAEVGIRLLQVLQSVQESCVFAVLIGIEKIQLVLRKGVIPIPPARNTAGLPDSCAG